MESSPVALTLLSSPRKHYLWRDLHRAIIFFPVHWGKLYLFLASHDRLPQHTKEPKLTQYPLGLQPGDIRTHCEQNNRLLLSNTFGFRKTWCYYSMSFKNPLLYHVMQFRETIWSESQTSEIKELRMIESERVHFDELKLSLWTRSEIQPEIQSTEFQL